MSQSLRDDISWQSDSRDRQVDAFAITDEIVTEKPFSKFLDFLEEHSIAAHSALRGCTDQEIQQLETRYGLTLPACYRQYLLSMGHKSGRLFTHDHLAVTYPHVIEMTAQYREDVREFPDEAHVDLPSDALIITGRLGEQFLFIRCDDADDSPVWYFNEYDTGVRQVYASVLDWLQSTATEAEAAIESGYYEIYPDGTGP